MTTKTGNKKTKSLFKEVMYSEDAVFTLKGCEEDGLADFVNLYFHYTDIDPTEYLFATTVLIDWNHWERITASPALKPYIKKLREERDVRLKQKALTTVVKELEGKNALAAAKYLLAETQERKPKAEKEKTKKEAFHRVGVDEDFDLLFKGN